LENGVWTQWDLSGPEDPLVVIVGLAIDNNGGVWTIFWDCYHTYYPIDINLTRWEDGQVAEVIPAIDGGILDFSKLFILNDGRFTFVYANEGGALAVAEQTASGEFARTFPPFFWAEMSPSSNGELNSFRIMDNKMIFRMHGSGSSGFHSGFAGIAPAGFNGNFGAPHIGVDSEDNFIYSTFLDDYALYLARFNGTSTTFEKWTNEPGEKFCPHYGDGVDHQDRPYVLLTKCDYNHRYVNCVLRKEADGIRTEHLGRILDEEGAVFYDQTSSMEGQTAAIALMGKEDGYSLRLFVRQRMSGDK
jgi:hypothetical protein